MEPIQSFRRGAGRLSLWAGAALLAGCSMLPKVATEQQAITGLTGMTETQVSACMGAPGTTLVRANGQPVWTYTPAVADMGMAAAAMTDPTEASLSYATFSGAVPIGSFPVAVAPPPPASCMVVLTFDQGHVINVIYTGPTGGPPPNWQACGIIAGRCQP